MKKKAWLLKRVFMISLVSYFFMLPITNVTGGWDCNYIYIDKTDEAGNTLTYTISLQETPNPLTTGTLTIGFDPSQLTFDHSDTIGCLPFDSVDIIPNPGELFVIGYTLGEPVPSGSSGCFCIITFTINQGVPDPEHPFIAGISDDFCPDNGCWCSTPMKCHVEITPTYISILSEETIDFSVKNVYCDDTYEPSNKCSVEGNCNSKVEPDTCTYTGGIVEGFCQDTVKVTDATNGSTAYARVDISPSVIVLPNPLLPCKTIIGSGASATFEATNKFCNSTPIYTWSVETSIGSTISPGSTIDAKGNYQAGREFSSCDDVRDTIKVEARCPENSIIRHGETTKVTIPACTVTINPSNPTVASYQTVQFEPTLECCKTSNEPLYTWSIDSAIGSTVYNSGLYKAGHNNNNKKATDTIKVTTTAFCTITHNVKVTVNPPQCKTSAECNDGIYCNGIEMCIREKCYPGHDRCLYDGQYCNGKESCDENNDKCLSSGDPCPPDLSCNEASDACGCLTNEDCDNDVFCDGAETCVEGVCQAGTNPCPVNEDFCDGVESCNEESDTCTSTGDPCTDPALPVCDEQQDKCVPQTPAEIEIKLTPNSVPRSHLLLLPLIMFIEPEENVESHFDRTTTVSFKEIGTEVISNAIWPPISLVLSPKFIFVLSLINPAGFDATGDSEVTVEVESTVDQLDGGSPYQEVGTTSLSLTMLPFILGE